MASGLLLEKLRVDGVEDVHRMIDARALTCVPLGSGVPHGTVLHACLGDTFLRAGEVSLDARARAVFEDKDHILLEMKLDPHSRLVSFRSGKEVLAGDVYVLCPGDVADYCATGNFSFAYLSLSADLLLRQGGEDALCGDAEFWRHRRWFRAPAASRALIVAAVQRVVSQLMRADAPVTGTALVQLQADLTEAFLWGVMLHQNRSSERHALSGAAIVRRVEDWVDDRTPEAVQIGDLCRELHLSRRTLQRAFTETLGIGPARYLSHKRLTAVRAELRRSDPAEVRVTDTATKYGFWQLGRFAQDYRRVFGECPSDTLHRPAARKPGNAVSSQRSISQAMSANPH